MSTMQVVALPEPHDYYYEWDGPYGKRKFTVAPHNGMPCDRIVPIYTADQMLAAIKAARSQALEEARRAVLGEVLHLEDVNCDEDVAYNAAIHHAQDAIRRLGEDAGRGES